MSVLGVGQSEIVVLLALRFKCFVQPERHRYVKPKNLRRRHQYLVIWQLGALFDHKVEFGPLSAQMLQLLKTLALIQQVQVIKLALIKSLVKGLDEVRHRVWHLHCVPGVDVLYRCYEVHEQTTK